MRRLPGCETIKFYRTGGNWSEMYKVVRVAGYLKGKSAIQFARRYMGRK
jgi:hypothetical protein